MPDKKPPNSAMSLFAAPLISSLTGSPVLSMRAPSPSSTTLGLLNELIYSRLRTRCPRPIVFLYVLRTRMTEKKSGMENPNRPKDESEVNTKGPSRLRLLKLDAAHPSAPAANAACSLPTFCRRLGRFPDILWIRVDARVSIRKAKPSMNAPSEMLSCLLPRVVRLSYERRERRHRGPRYGLQTLHGRSPAFSSLHP